LLKSAGSNRAPASPPAYFETCGRALLPRQPMSLPSAKSPSVPARGQWWLHKKYLGRTGWQHSCCQNVEHLCGSLTSPLACVKSTGFSVPPTIQPNLAVIAGPGAVGNLPGRQVRRGYCHVWARRNRDKERLTLARYSIADYTFNVSKRSLLPSGTPVVGLTSCMECSGADSAARDLLELVGGERYVQIDLSGETGELAADQICKTRSPSGNASTPAAWQRALALACGQQGQNSAAHQPSAAQHKRAHPAFKAFEHKRGQTASLAPRGVGASVRLETGPSFQPVVSCPGD